MTAGWQYVGSRSQPQQQTQSFKDVAYQIEPGTSSTEPRPLDVVCLARSSQAKRAQQRTRTSFRRA